jgi:hypothetical protein
MLIKAYDFGGSAIREMDILKGGSKVRKTLSKYKRLDINAPIRKDIEVLHDDFIIEKAPWKPIEGQRFAKAGAFSMHKGAIEGTDNQALKSRQDGTYVNAAYMVATDILKSKTNQEVIKGATGPYIQYNEDDAKLGVCIPAGEYYSPVGADSIKDGLAGSYVVHFPVLNKTVKFKIHRKDITVSAEGVVALYIFFKTKYADAIKTSNIITLDAGYRSLDVTVLKNFAPEGGSSRSFAMGGITLEALVASEFERASLFCSTEDAVMAIETGFINKGQSKLPVGGYVQTAKRILARRIHDSAIMVLNTTGMFKQNINYLAPIGRCFEVVGKEGDSHYTGDLMAYVKEIWSEEVGVLKVHNLEEANVQGLSEGLKKKYGGLLEAVAAANTEEMVNEEHGA